MVNKVIKLIYINKNKITNEIITIINSQTKMHNKQIKVINKEIIMINYFFEKIIMINNFFEKIKIINEQINIINKEIKEINSQIKLLNKDEVINNLWKAWEIYKNKIKEIYDLFEFLKIDYKLLGLPKILNTT